MPVGRLPAAISCHRNLPRHPAPPTHHSTSAPGLSYESSISPSRCKSAVRDFQASLLSLLWDAWSVTSDGMLDCGSTPLCCYGGNLKILVALVLQCRWLPFASVLGIDAALYPAREVCSGWSLFLHFCRRTLHESTSRTLDTEAMALQFRFDSCAARLPSLPLSRLCFPRPA
ncbi:hypothetical protein FB451DRAFT_1413340 [Mycena latifolia]|nr:hypothetical protein FB451DRAFT_1413340 [Mycena latifolia]